MDSWSYIRFSRQDNARGEDGHSSQTSPAHSHEEGSERTALLYKACGTEQRGMG